MKTIYTKDAPEAIGPYSQGIVAENILFTSGQIPLNPETNEVVGCNIENQTVQVMKNVGAVLKAAGSDFKKAIKTTCFLSDMADFASFNKIYANYFVSKPARSCVAVKNLPKGVLVEVEVIASLE